MNEITMQRYPPSKPVNPDPLTRQRAKLLADSRQAARQDTSTTATNKLKF